MIFCHTKKDADELACSSEIKQESHVMHGDVPQDKRELVLKVIDLFLSIPNQFLIFKIKKKFFKRNSEMENTEY